MVMHIQTQPIQFFTVFGSYVIEGTADYSPLKSGRSDRQDYCNAEEMKSADALPEAARHCNQHQYAMAA
jgi:hypothetical protein